MTEVAQPGPGQDDLTVDKKSPLSAITKCKTCSGMAREIEPHVWFHLSKRKANARGPHSPDVYTETPKGQRARALLILNDMGGVDLAIPDLPVFLAECDRRTMGGTRVKLDSATAAFAFNDWVAEVRHRKRVCEAAFCAWCEAKYPQGVVKFDHDADW